MKILKIRTEGKVFECPTETITTCVDINCVSEVIENTYEMEEGIFETYNETIKTCDEECTSEDGFINQFTRCTGGAYLGEKI